MTGGYVGKILRINLTSKTISTIDTAKYEEFGGGFGIGAAIFWDLAVAPGQWDLQDAYDPRNVIALMSGPLAATGTPAAGRTSVCGIASSTYPTDMFYRTNFGTRFGDEWQQIGESYTTARPQIVCIGPVGEARARVAALIHGSGVSGRNGGFGGVFGAKNLKAISVTGTGSVQAANPKGVVDTRIWHLQNFPKITTVSAGASACMPCINNERKRNSYYGGESICADSLWYFGKGEDLQMKGADIAMKWGISSWVAPFG